jgi:hypothetical protein
MAKGEKRNSAKPINAMAPVDGSGGTLLVMVHLTSKKQRPPRRDPIDKITV